MTTPLTPASPGSGDSNTSASTPVAASQPAAGPAATAPAAPVATAGPVGVTPKRSPGWLNLLLGAAAVIAVGGVAFAIGRSTVPADAVGFIPGGPVMVQPGGSFDPGSGPIVREGGPGGLMGAGLSLDGTVTAVDADSVTIRLASGEEVTFDLDAETTYHEATAADASAIAVGDEIAVQASGGRIQIDSEAGGGSASNGTPTLSAEDVTVRR